MNRSLTNSPPLSSTEGAATLAELRQQLLDMDMRTFNSANYRALNRQLKSITEGPQIKMAFLGNMTLSLLPPYIAAHCAREGWLLKSHVGHFGQYFQALMSPDFAEFSPDFVVLALSLRLLRPDAMATFTSISQESRRDLRDDVLNEIESWVKLATSATQATLLVANFAMPSVPALGIADTKDTYGETEFYLELNLQLMRRMRSYQRVQILDINRIAARLGHMHAFDERLFHISKTDWSEPFMAAIGQEIVRHVVGAKGTAKKCLVLDIDNTLWGGVVGEDGPAGVKVGHGDPESEAFMAFQQRIRALKDRGILLALCSKNNPADVEEAFQLRQEMPLKMNDFSAKAIGWEPKHQGLAHIAADLNIGIDSLVFLDDNPAEIALIRERMPMVESVLLPEDPSAFVATLDALTCFEKAVVLADDVHKARQYQEEAERTRFSTQHANMGDYLTQLQMEVQLKPVDADNLQRIHQMFAKTNQFNVTTKRYTLGELEAMLHADDYHLGMVSLRDRFGDLGIIAAFILIEDGASLHIDSLLMSCRAMGRGVETAMMNYIKQQFMEQPHLQVMTAEFIATAKNKPAADYFPNQGLRPAELGEAGQFYTLKKAEVEYLACGWIQIKGEPLWRMQKEFS